MRFSQLFSKTFKKVPEAEVSLNARLLIKAGFIDKLAAGIYTFLPLGQRVIKKISAIVEEEMGKIGAQEIVMPVLHPKINWQRTGRWDNLDILFKLRALAGEFALGPTHEEVVVPLAKKFISTYRDLPKAVYQIQTKFRDELRAKSGLLRCREFLMKDLYSFHSDEDDLMSYYDVVKLAYSQIFERLSLETIIVEASGGSFSKFSHEFQVVADNGEDIICICPNDHTHFARNKEIVNNFLKCPVCKIDLVEKKAIEIGNIFPLKTKYSQPFNLTFTDKNGDRKLVMMGCYGIGISRLMGTIVEVHNDEKGIIWPKTVAPFLLHLIDIGGSQTQDQAYQLYRKLSGLGVEVIWDDRENVTPGEKFADCDLMGMPLRLVISEKLDARIEIRERKSGKVEVVALSELVRFLESKHLTK